MSSRKLHEKLREAPDVSQSTRKFSVDSREDSGLGLSRKTLYSCACIPPRTSPETSAWTRKFECLTRPNLLPINVFLLR